MIEPTDQWSVVVADGKYCVRFTYDNSIVVERYKEALDDPVNDTSKLVYALATELIKARRSLSETADDVIDSLEKEPPCP